MIYYYYWRIIYFIKWFLYIAVHDSDCATAGVDTSVFSDFVGPSCIKNSCLE